MISAEAIYYGSDAIRLSWNLKGADFHRHCEVYVERSGGYSGPFNPLSGPFVDQAFFLDTQIGLSRWFYRLRIVTGNDTVYYPEQGGISIEPESGLLAAEVARELTWSLYESGRKVLYYPVRQFGTPCSCWDPVTSNYNKKCLSCFGKKFANGFFNPLVVPAVVATNVMDKQGKRVDEVVRRMVVPHVPEARTGDVIVERENTRWEVANVTPTESRRVRVQQVLTVNPLGRDSVMANLPADFSLLGTDDDYLLERVS